MPRVSQPARLLPEAEQERLRGLLSEFGREWSAESLTVTIQQLASEESPEFRRAALLEFVRIDLGKRWRRNDRRPVEWYLEQYPDFAAEDLLLPLVLTEATVSQNLGEQVDLHALEARFPTHADALRAAFEQWQALRSQGTMSLVNATTSRVADAVPVDEDDEPLPRHFGRYRILKRLGRGAMGQVFLADDTQLNRRVALKVPRRSELRGSEIRDRFNREAQAAGTLRHPNICPVYDVGRIDGRHYISMAYIEGRPLTAYISRSKVQKPRHVATTIRKLALALEEAHRQGIIHRDLKPANIMIDNRGEPIVMDFGLARQSNTVEQAKLTQSGAILGTPAYMSPEQVSCEHDQVGPRSDIYSLGVILYQLLCGDTPFHGPVGAVLVQIATQSPRPPSEVRPGVDAQLEAICLRMMAKEPAERFQSMREVAAVLTDYIRSGGVAGSPAEATANNVLEIEFAALESPADAVPSLAAGSELNSGATRMAKRAWSKLTSRTGRTMAALVPITALACFLLMSDRTEVVTIDPSDPVHQTLSSPDQRFDDLLARIELPSNVVAGDWRRDGDALVCVQGEQMAAVQIPVTPPAEYELRLEVERPPGESPHHGYFVGLVVGGSPCCVFLDSDRIERPSFGLTRLDNLDWDQNETTRFYNNLLLKAGERRTFVFTVGPNRVRVTSQGEILIDWTGDPSRLTAPVGTESMNPSQLAIGSNCPLRFTRIEWRPLAEPAQPKAVERDLLALIPDAEAGTDGQRVLTITDTKDAWNWTEVPNVAFELPEEYDLRMKVTRRALVRKQRDLGLRIVFPLPGSRTFLYLDGYFGSGLEGIGGKDYSHGPAKFEKHQLFWAGRESTVECRIRKTGVAVIVDGERIIDWKGDPARVVANRRLPQSAFAVSCHQSRYEIREWTLIELPPSAE